MEIKYGYRPDPQAQIQKFQTFSQDKFSLTTSDKENIDLRPFSPKTRHDQLSTSSCVCNAVTRALEIKRIMRYGQDKHVPLSRMDLYFGCRERMSPPETMQDAGTYIYLACNVLTDFGVCRESTHPFTTENLYKLPPVMASREARMNRVTSQFRINSLNDERIDDMKFNLKAGNPIVFGGRVGKDWQEYNKNSKAPLTVDSRPLGLHAQVVVGYVFGLFLVENSWSGNWGHDGFALVDPEYFKEPDTTDLWVINDGTENWKEKE